MTAVKYDTMYVYSRVFTDPERGKAIFKKTSRLASYIYNLARITEAFDIDDEICAEKGFSDYANVARNVVEGYPHDWSALRIIYRDFALRLFR